MNSNENYETDNYYNVAIQLAKSHYENFPVVSLFIKKELHKHVAVIYQFARQADDLADEGNITVENRISALDGYEKELNYCLDSRFETGFWRILKNTIDEKKLSTDNFFNLLNAFRQDVNKNRYKNYDELLDYCKKSANPIGRLILELNNVNHSYAKNISDKICTALQLTNFYQDVSIDIKKNRIYIPGEEMLIFHVTEKDIINGNFNERFINLMKYQIERTKRLFIEGRELLKYLPYMLRLQIIVTIKGGEAILKKIENLNYNVLEMRPVLSRMEFVKLFLSAFIFGK